MIFDDPDWYWIKVYCIDGGAHQLCLMKKFVINNCGAKWGTQQFVGIHGSVQRSCYTYLSVGIDGGVHQA